MKPFGTFDGQPVHRVALSDGTLTAHVITWGAVLQDLRHAALDHPLVLGFETFEPYPDHSPFFGAIAGRVANRIGGARFTLDGREHRTATKPGEGHTLHGGPGGMGRRVWRVEEQAGDSVTLAITDPDGLNGFPGTLEARCRYALAAGALHVTLTATTDAPTPVNLAHHTYWNLDGADTVLDHRLAVAADRYSAVDDDFIPTGETPSVAGSRFDFREGRRLGEATERGLVDHNLIVSDERTGLREVARVEAGDVRLSVGTTEPGLQVYAGHKVNVAVPGLDGRRYGKHAGLALEPQVWPDAVNQPHFPSMILRPGETYRQESVFRVSVG